MSKSYPARECYVCFRMISSAGFAWVAHARKHVRQGYLTERIVQDPLWKFPSYREYDRTDKPLPERYLKRKQAMWGEMSK